MTKKRDYFGCARTHAMGVQSRAKESTTDVTRQRVVTPFFSPAPTHTHMSTATLASFYTQPWKGRFAEVSKALDDFMRTTVIPAEPRYYAQRKANIDKGDAWSIVPVVEELKREAQKRGLWNLFLPAASGLTQHEYAQLAERMGGYPYGVEAFNCDAPDTGNMETLHLFGTPEQKQKYLVPLLSGTLRSAFCMTEPDVASSDASNLQMTATPDGDDYILHGRKWWASGFGHPKCKVLIVMVSTAASEHSNVPPHERHSMFVVDRDTPGISGVRAMQVFGSDDAPHGHFEVLFNKVRVPSANILVGPGKGFHIAQGRLGPGRIHHCMRSIGMAERALSLMVARAAARTAFRAALEKHGMVQEAIAESRIEIEQARLLVLQCAKLIDQGGSRAAVKNISIIKVDAPRAACRVIDRAIQVHGAMGVSQDTPLAAMYAWQRALRIADGPDEVHLTTVAKVEVARQRRSKL